GRGWLIQPKKEDEKWLKTGEWNKMKIMVNGDEVTTFLNGHQMVYFKDAKIGQANGFIALQIHDGGGIKVRWRNIKIKEL
ncbi:MAG: family 16 glycoside hydrolase, partial [Sphingobacteriales bacterium]